MLRFAIALLGTALALAQDPGHRTPFPAHRIAGNLYYVGTRDLACFLIASDQGHILINTGYRDSGPMIRKSVEDLGFKTADIKILLVQQAHGDHIEALGDLKELTGARMLATEADAPALERPGRNWQGVKVDGLLKDGEVIELGGTKLTVILSPGHTKGSASYSLTVREGRRDYKVLIVNMPTLGGHPTLLNDRNYPNVLDDFEYTFKMLRRQAYDILLGAHASHYGMLEKYKPGQPHSPETFVDRGGLAKALDEWERQYRERLVKERAQ